MASKTDFNVSPYFDDYDEAKKFHRVMYRPAFAVQARELTTQQSITQNQIEKMGDHLFKHGAMVIPGETSVDLDYQSVKLTSFTGTLDNLIYTTVTGGTSGVVAEVVNVVATDGTDPDTLFVKYKNSGTDNASPYFTDGETLTSDASGGETAVVSTTADGSAVHINAGTYYINGFFVNVNKQVLVLDKYNKQPSYRIGLTIVEKFITSTDDTSLLDNATGSSNANATGAHRFKIDLVLTKLSLNSSEDENFVELIRIENGVISRKVEATSYNQLEHTLARRTFDESGDYTVESFDIDIRESLDNGSNNGVYGSGLMTNIGNLADDELLAVGMGAGIAYVKGYEVRKIGTTFVDLFKARDFLTDNGIVTRFAQLPFVNITNLFGTPDVGFISDETESFKTVRLLNKKHTARGTALTNNDGTVHDIGRAKTRGIEYNAGTASGVFMSSSTLKTNTYKHYLFDVVMFAHLNVKGAGSASLTTGETLTGGTSGATAIVESITSEGTATITGVTQANPPVVTMSGGHNFLEGQSILIASVAGMTDINAYHTVKNPTATTFELYAPSTSTNSAPAPRDTTSSTAWSSGGTVSHTIVILSDVNGEFSVGETATGSSSDSTVVVQFDAFGCKGFEQKIFPQTYGVSGASSPAFTADTDVSATYGKNAALTGTLSTVASSTPGSVVLDGTDSVSANAGDSIILEDATDSSSEVIALGLEAPANQGDVMIGFGTLFKDQLRIGDQIIFTDDSGTEVEKIVASITSDTKLETITGLTTTPATKVSAKRQRAKIQFAENDRALFKLPYEVVKTLLTTDNSGISDTSFKIRRQFVSTLSSSGTATLTAGTNEVFTAHSEADVTVSVMTKGGSATAGEVGDVITLSNSGDYTLGGSPTGKTLAINLGSTFNGSKVKILATVSTSVASAKTKTSTTATLTVDGNSGLSNVSGGNATLKEIPLGYADVYQVASVHMADDFSTAATTSDTDITDRFQLDTGMRDNYYDIARLRRIPGKAVPTGRLLITFDYFEHGAGNFFSVDSYSGFDYGSIPAYTSDVTGETYQLRDVLDFRPRVDNASTIGIGSQDRQYSGTGASTIEFPKFNTDITNDLEFYLAKKAKMYMMSNGKFEIQEGESSVSPQAPEILKDGMHLYDLFLPAYTFNPKDVVIKKVDNRRYTMRDIGRLEQRIENVEYYTQLSLLEAEAQNMQIQDADGFDRFKNGIIVDNFTGHGVGDVADDDYSVSMNMSQGELRPSFNMDNAKLQEIDEDLSTAITDTARTTLGYQKTGDLITLPYVSIPYITQPYASTTVNLQPYETINYIGNITLDPDQDDWMETNRIPEFVHHISGTYDTFRPLAGARTQSNGALSTVWGAWNDSWTGTIQETNRVVNPSTTLGNVTSTTTSITTQQRVGRTRSGIRTSLVPNEVRKGIGDRVLNTSFAMVMRPIDITFSVVGMKPNTRIFAFFDGIDVNENVTPTGSSAGAALTTDANGSASGVFSIPKLENRPKPMVKFADPWKQFQSDYAGQKYWRTGRKTFRLTSNASNSLTGDIFTSAQTDFISSGLKKSVQGTIVSVKEPIYQEEIVNETTVIDRPGSKIETSQTVHEQKIHHDPATKPHVYTHFPSPGEDFEPFVTDSPFRPTTIPSQEEDKITDREPGYKPISLGHGQQHEAEQAARERRAAAQAAKEASDKAAKIAADKAASAAAQAAAVAAAKARESKEKNIYSHPTRNQFNPAPVVKTPPPAASGSPNGRSSRGSSKKYSAPKASFTRCSGPPFSRDPVAQSFLCDTVGGVFVSSIDLFFSNKATDLPVTLQLRTMINGYPTREVMPFGEVNVAAADINVSTTGTTATKFTFPSPVYLMPNTEYAFVALSNSKDYTIYTARMGQKTLDDSRLISKQPLLGSMFKSQNAGTWTPEQNEDVKFEINTCSFTEDTIGNVFFVNEELPVQTLEKINPISTTSGSADITIHHKNHGMHSTSANVTIAGVPSGTHNGIASTNINGTYTTIKNIKMDSYQVTAQNSDTASVTGDVGGNGNVTATRNILFDVIQPVVGNVVHENTSLFASMRTTGGRTLEGGETEYSLDTIAKQNPVAIGDDYYMTAPGMIASGINETNEMSGAKSFTMTFGLHTPNGNNNLSPVIDTKQMSVHLIQNRLDNPISGTTPDFIAETTNTGGSSAAKYMTKPIALENPSTALDIRLSANIRASSDVKMYYRVSGTEDVRLLGDVAWTAFNDTGSPDSSVPPAEDNVTFKEQQYSVSDIPEFTAFQLKVVMTGTNSSYPPIIKDLRGIALAV